MELILTQDVPKLGNAGDLVRVRDGYGRNYLLPQGMALLATRARMSDLEHKKRLIEERQRKERTSLEAVAKGLSGLELVFEAKVGEEGKLFGSVTSGDIAERVREKGMEIDRRKLELAEPIRQVGEYEVAVSLHREVTAKLKVVVVAGE